MSGGLTRYTDGNISVNINSFNTVKLKNDTLNT
jgi:hypothetical protein